MDTGLEEGEVGILDRGELVEEPEVNSPASGRYGLWRVFMVVRVRQTQTGMDGVYVPTRRPFVPGEKVQYT